MTGKRAVQIIERAKTAWEKWALANGGVLVIPVCGASNAVVDWAGYGVQPPLWWPVHKAVKPIQTAS